MGHVSVPGDVVLIRLDESIHLEALDDAADFRGRAVLLPCPLPPPPPGGIKGERKIPSSLEGVEAKDCSLYGLQASALFVVLCSNSLAFW